MQAAKLLGNNPMLANCAYSCTIFNVSPVCAQSIRFRKPIWLGTAKTKIFRVPQRPKIPKDELNEIMRLYNNYRTQMKSISLFYKELAKENENKEDQSALNKIEEDDFKTCFEINDEWNKRVGAEREARMEEFRYAKRLLIKQNVEAKKKRDEELKQKIEQKIREAKALVPTLITRENIDQAIEDALAQTVNHNKALESDGTWYTDSTGLPQPKTTEKTETVRVQKQVNQ